ncbi:MAG: beta-lactamase family protein [Clostridia bacterium]|nr:beta-lactamase family protein [Clostridia bacterium]
MNAGFYARIENFVENYYKKNQNSGFLRLTVKDEIIYEKALGYANIEKGLAVTEKSLFTLYSLSKPFCAIGLLKLKDEQLIDIDKHPGTYLPEAKGLHKDITIRHLLNHTSGLPDFDQHTDFRQKYHGETSEQLKEQLTLIAEKEMLFAPGTNGIYTNINFIICALIIENVTGMAYADYMKTNVFETLGMFHTQVDNKHLSIADRVQGYCKKDGNIVPIHRVDEWVLGCADIISNVNDIYCLNKAIKHQLILKPETWKEVLTPSPLNSMGFGCTVSEWHGKTRITHGGGWEGFRTLHIQVPEDDFDIIFLSNSAWGNARDHFAEELYEAYFCDDTDKGDVVKMDVGYI